MKTFIREEDGIIFLGTGESLSKEGYLIMMDQVIEKLRKYKGTGRVLVHAAKHTPSLADSENRKMFAERVKEIFNEVGFKRVAIFGGDIFSRTITSFIIFASGIKDIKVFKKKEEALSWLKES